MFTPSRRYTAPREALKPHRSLATHLAGSTPAQIQGSEPNTSSSVQGKPHPVASSVDGPRSKSADGWDAIAWLHRGRLSGFKIPRDLRISLMQLGDRLHWEINRRTPYEYPAIS